MFSIVTGSTLTMHASLTDRGFIHRCVLLVCCALFSMQDAPTHGRTIEQADGLARVRYSPVRGGCSSLASARGISIRQVLYTGHEPIGLVVPLALRPDSLHLGPDTTLCPGATLLLNATMPNASYQWQNGSTDSTFHITAAGTYHVAVELPNGDTYADTVVVSYSTVPPYQLGPDRIICPDESITLYVQPVQGASYVWSDGVVGPARIVDKAGDLRITVSLDHCVFESAISVAVDNCLPSIELPSIFTPHGDSLDNTFSATSMNGVKRMEITIYDRWGQAVFHSTNTGFRWDGRTAAGLPVPDGTYYWVLTHTLEKTPGEEQSLTGTVTLTR